MSSTQELNASGKPIFNDAKDMLAIARYKRSCDLLAKILYEKHPEGDERFHIEERHWFARIA